MQKHNTLHIPILLSNQNTVIFEIVPRTKGGVIEHKSELEAKKNGEARIQIIEGYSYEYKLTNDFELIPTKNIVRQSKFNASMGIINPGNYVGTLSLTVRNISNRKISGSVQLEVQSLKVDYRTDYRFMLNDIAERCTELIMQHSVPISQRFSPNYKKSDKSIYQRFSFIKSIIDSKEFELALHKIVQSPITIWEFEETKKDVSRIKRLNSKQLRQLAHASAGSNIKLSAYSKKETVDAPENRFVKYALQQFLDTCSLFYSKLTDKTLYAEEISRLQEKMHYYLRNEIFKSVGNLKIVPLNSPILQRKEGYREVLRTWLMFSLAAQLQWEGGNDIYEGGKKDVAILYEYWLFFQLHDIIIKTFALHVPNIDYLIEPTKDGLGLKLKRGNFISINGLCEAFTRKLHIQLSYNRTFPKERIYPDPGSWTTSLRPDYTLSIWPWGFNAEQAEREELIVHIHFDAKYRVGHLQTFSDSKLHEHEKSAALAGKRKNSDLSKMHTYRDAIRRTAGAYVLYPGTKSTNHRGFHEVLPGLGAFAIRPSKDNSGIYELERFLKDVVELLLNRASQREKMSLKTFEIHKQPPTPALNVSLPETFGLNRNLLLEETKVLVGYYKNDQHLTWILSKKLYNTRIKSLKNVLYLDPSFLSVQYLLLYSKSEKRTNKFYKIIVQEGRIFSKQELIKLKYPTKPSGNNYLIFEITPSLDEELKGRKWDVTKLKNFKPGRSYGLPFVTDLAEIMRVLTIE